MSPSEQPHVDSARLEDQLLTADRLLGRRYSQPAYPSAPPAVGEVRFLQSKPTAS